jgi:6-phosphogluconolactonase
VKVKSGASIERFSTPQELFHAAAEEVIRVANQSVSERGRFTIALSGGSTPRNLYNLIAANASTSLPWSKIFFFWGDERHVPPTDAESNYRMAKETILSKVPVPQANSYEQTLQKFFAVERGKFPSFDLILLGMGPDGHTASLFPETPALKEKSHLVVANWVEKLHASRITLTLPVLNAARELVFLVSGADKAAVLHEVLEGNAPPEKYPSKLVLPNHGKLIWLIDRAAASELSESA